MTFLGMMISKVDPFAVYAAERNLAQHGRKVRRDVLVSHYLVRGQLRTLVSKVIASGDDASAENCAAAAIVEGPDESANPRFVSPLKTGLVYSAGVLAAVAILGSAHLARMGTSPRQIDWRWSIVIGVALVAICMGYAYLGAQAGRVKANKVMSLIVALAFVGFIYWLSKHLGQER